MEPGHLVSSREDRLHARVASARRREIELVRGATSAVGEHARSSIGCSSE
jgi:hypothetical protein